ncbi:MAG: FtsX-like permease family protein [Planctomycetota bacterium]
MYKWFLVGRYLHTKLIALLGVAAVMLCVAMVLVVVSVMGGFLDTIRARAKGLHSEIVLDTGSPQGFPFYEEFSKYVSEKLPDVVRATTPAIWTFGIFRVPANTLTKPARVFGIRFDGYSQVNDFKKGLQYERFFPGTTQLGLQGMPVAGVNERGQLQLPAELESANATWRGKESDPSKLAEFENNPFATTAFPRVTADMPGDRVFSSAPGEPFYGEPRLPGAIIGTDLLFYRRMDGNFDRFLARGATVTTTLITLTASGNMSGEPAITVPLRYADDARSGIYEIDSMAVYVDFDMLQNKLAMDPQERVDGSMTRARTTQLLIGLRESVGLDESRVQIAEAWRSFRGTILEPLTRDEEITLAQVEVFSWEDLQRSFILAVEKEKILVTLLFGLISIVAIVLIGCIFYMLVEKKTKDIGILKSLGASSGGVMGMFILYAAAIGVTGAVLGTFGGSLFVWYINDIQDWLATLNPALRVWSPEVYSFDRIPETVKTADVLWVGIFAIVSSMVGSLIPATIAGRVWPVQALRYE